MEIKIKGETYLRGHRIPLVSTENIDPVFVIWGNNFEDIIAELHRMSNKIGFTDAQNDIESIPVCMPGSHEFSIYNN